MNVENFEKRENIAETKSLEFQGLNEIVFREVNKEDPDFEEAIPVYVEPETSLEEVTETVRGETIKRYWWLQAEWREKGLPREEIEIVIGGKKVYVYNFSDALVDQHLQELKRVVIDFHKIRSGRVFDEIEYVLINNTQKKNDYSGEDGNGKGLSEMRAIELYPRATKFFKFRVGNVSNFEGVVIHEFTHPLVHPGDLIGQAWIKKFGWEFTPMTKDRYPGGMKKSWTNHQPERCVSDYAKFAPEEDICETMVIALRDPESLDMDKLSFIKENFFLSKRSDGSQPQVALHVKIGADMTLPRVELPVKFKRIPSLKTRGREIKILE